MPLFDSSMSALPILCSHPGTRVSLFTCQQGTWAGFRPSRDRLVLSYCCQSNQLIIYQNQNKHNTTSVCKLCVQLKTNKYYHRGSNWGSSTRGTALTRYVVIGCYDSGNNPDSNACRIYTKQFKYIWTPLKIEPGLVMWWSMLIKRNKQLTLNKHKHHLLAYINSLRSTCKKSLIDFICTRAFR